MLLVRDGSCCLKFKGLHGRETLDGVAAEAILYGATISACEKGWFLAASLLGEMKHVHLRLDVINFNASVSIFRRGHAWLVSGVLLAAMYSEQVVPDVFSLTSATNACESACQWAARGESLAVMSLSLHAMQFGQREPEPCW